MACGGARALTLRIAALGGFTAAAWLLSGTGASASPGEAPPPTEITAEITTGTAPKNTAELTAGIAEKVTAGITVPGSVTEVTVPGGVTGISAGAPSPVDDPAGWAQAFSASLAGRTASAKVVPVVVPPVVVPPVVVPAPVVPHPAPQDEGPALDFTGGSQGATRSGSVSNQAPPEVVQAKAQVRAARKAARLAAEQPPPPPPPAPAAAPVVAEVERIVPPAPAAPAPAAPAQAQPTPVSDLTWTEPSPLAPLPAPQQAPVASSASAPCGHTDNSGGTRGVLAVLTSQNSLFPTTTWSVEERRDGTVPGGVPGLPSTSPD